MAWSNSLYYSCRRLVLYYENTLTRWFSFRVGCSTECTQYLFHDHFFLTNPPTREVFLPTRFVSSLLIAISFRICVRLCCDLLSYCCRLVFSCLLLVAIYAFEFKLTQSSYMHGIVVLIRVKGYLQTHSVLVFGSPTPQRRHCIFLYRIHVFLRFLSFWTPFLSSLFLEENEEA